MEEWRYGISAGADADVAIVKAVYEAFARRDLDAIAAVIAPDAELLGGPTEQAAGADAAYRGADGLQRYFADIATVWGEISAYPDDFRASLGSVVVFGRLVTASVDGTRHTRSVMWTWRLHEGRIASLRVNDLSAPPE